MRRGGGASWGGGGSLVEALRREPCAETLVRCNIRKTPRANPPPLPPPSVGMFYREELFKACSCMPRLPPPSVFSSSFFEAYAHYDAQHPCFGAGGGLTSEEWWRGVVRRTYEGVRHIDLEEGLREELEGGGEGTLFETVFQRL